MPVAVAAPSLPVSSAPSQAPADGASSSITSADFATLLLGQLSVETGLSKLAVDPESTLTLPADTASIPQDPALLLASMGITGFSIQPERAVESGNRAADVSASGLPEGGVALPQIPGVAQLPAPAGNRVGAEATAPLINNSPAQGQISPPSQTQITASVQTETPAKLAGFEQKLADTVQGLTETTPSPQQLTTNATGLTNTTELTNAAQLVNATQFASNAAANLRHTSESVRVDAPLRDQAWPAEFGQKVVWLATQDKQSAQITLNPPQLGPIEISLSVKSDQATAVFASANAEVREAIESALPRLREMLAGVGVELGQTNVSAESFRHPGDSGSNNRGNSSGGNGNDNGTGTAVRGETMMIGKTAIKRGNGLVDTFA